MRCLSLIALLVVASRLADGQAAPTAVPSQRTGMGLNIPWLNGGLQYGLNASQLFQTGYYGGGWSKQASVSGDVAFSTKSETGPFSLVYTGGVQIPEESNISTNYFQSLALAQSVLLKSWTLSGTDVVSYLPQSPTVGLSGIPGTGDLGLAPVGIGGEPAQDVLTTNSTRVSNTVSGSVGRRLSGRDSISGSASYGLLHFFGDTGIDNTQISASAGMSHQFDARTSANIGASYSIFRYDVAGHSSFTTRGVSAGAQRQVTRALGVFGSGGPQWVNSSDQLAIPSRLTWGASLGATYLMPIFITQVSYSRGINAGSGVQTGSISDSVTGSLSRRFGPSWSTSLNAGFTRSQGLATMPTPANVAVLGIANSGSIKGFYGGAQASRRISRSVSATGSYTALTQSSSNALTTQATLSGTVQSFALGISYSPRQTHLGFF